MNNNFTIKGSLTIKSGDFDIELNDFETNFSSEMNERETESTANIVSTILSTLTSVLMDNNKPYPETTKDDVRNKPVAIIEDFRETATKTSSDTISIFKETETETEEKTKENPNIVDVWGDIKERMPKDFREISSLGNRFEFYKSVNKESDDRDKVRIDLCFKNEYIWLTVVSCITDHTVEEELKGIKTFRMSINLSTEGEITLSSTLNEITLLDVLKWFDCSADVIEFMRYICDTYLYK